MFVISPSPTLPSLRGVFQPGFAPNLGVVAPPRLLHSVAPIPRSREARGCDAAGSRIRSPRRPPALGSSRLVALHQRHASRAHRGPAASVQDRFALPCSRATPHGAVRCASSAFCRRSMSPSTRHRSVSSRARLSRSATRARRVPHHLVIGPKDTPAMDAHELLHRALQDERRTDLVPRLLAPGFRIQPRAGSSSSLRSLWATPRAEGRACGRSDASHA